VEERPQASYYVDESDPDIAILRRQDGSFVAAFSARGVTGEGIVEAAREDYRDPASFRAATSSMPGFRSTASIRPT
jgi:hypothetical protein